MTLINNSVQKVRGQVVSVSCCQTLGFFTRLRGIKEQGSPSNKQGVGVLLKGTLMAYIDIITVHRRRDASHHLSLPSSASDSLSLIIFYRPSLKQVSLHLCGSSDFLFDQLQASKAPSHLFISSSVCIKQHHTSGLFCQTVCFRRITSHTCWHLVMNFLPVQHFPWVCLLDSMCMPTCYWLKPWPLTNCF